MKTINKSVLKQGYYWECKDFYDNLKEDLPVVAVQEHIFLKTMTYQEILKEYNITPCDSYEQAAIIAANAIPTIKKGEYRILFFIDEGIPCRLGVWRNDDGKLRLDVRDVDPDDSWIAGDGVLVSNETKDLGPKDTLTLSTSDTLDDVAEHEAIQLLKSKGFKITKEY